MTTKIWQFKRVHKNGNCTVEITVELRDEDDHLGAFADDDYYYGDLTKEESIDLARAVLAKLDTPFPFGTHVRVTDGAYAGIEGPVAGTLQEGDVLVLADHGQLLIVPAKFLMKA